MRGARVYSNGAAGAKPAAGNMAEEEAKTAEESAAPSKGDLRSTLKDKRGKPINWGSAQLFVGSTGMILSNYSQHVLLRDGKVTDDFKRPEATIPNSIGHHREWTEAIKTGGTTTCNFDYSGALTESVMLGIVAYRSGKQIDWDAKHLKVTNAPEAQSLIHKEYRQGWTL